MTVHAKRIKTSPTNKIYYTNIDFYFINKSVWGYKFERVGHCILFFKHIDPFAH